MRPVALVAIGNNPTTSDGTSQACTLLIAISQANQEAMMLTPRMTACEDRELCARIIGEFLEMPGLNVTLAQACRLWSIDQPRCLRALDTLRRSGFLHRSGDRYLRADADWRAA